MTTRMQEKVSANGASTAVEKIAQPLVSEDSRAVAIARRGIPTVRAAALFSEALACDAVLGLVSPRVAGVALTGVNTMLRAVDLQNRFGKPDQKGQRDVVIVPADDEQKDLIRQKIEVKRAELAALESQLTP